MKRILLLLLLVSLAGQAGANSFFKVIETPVAHVTPCENASFDVTVQNLGGDWGYAKLIFRDMPQGIWIVEDGGTLRADPGSKLTYNLVIGAGRIDPGNYSFDIGIAAKGSPSNYHRAYAVVDRPTFEAIPEANLSQEDEESMEEEPLEESPADGALPASDEKAPATGALTVALALLVGWRISRQ